MSAGIAHRATIMHGRLGLHGPLGRRAIQMQSEPYPLAPCTLEALLAVDVQG